MLSILLVVGVISHLWCAARLVGIAHHSFYSVCYITGRSDILGFISRVVCIAVVKSHEAKPSAISPLYRKRVEYIPEFLDFPCYNILMPWLHNGGAISLFFTLVGDISRLQPNQEYP